MAERARAVLAVTLYVVLLRQRRDARRIAAQLPETLQNNFGTPVITFYFTLDLNLFSLQLPNIANLL